MAIPLTRAADGSLLALVGRRRSRFLGGFFAFPGGATEPEDGDPDGDEDACLRRTAARELREETGLQVRPEDLLDAGRRVTPPFFPRRFDTLMYVAFLDRAVEPVPENPGEMEDLQWSPPASVRDRWRELQIRVAPPLIPMLQDLADVGGDAAEEIAARLRATNDRMEAPAGPRIEFVPDVLMVPLDTPTLPPATTTNCYLIGSREFVILDPGAAGTEGERLLEHVRLRRGEGATPRAVLLSHHHGDHTGGVAAVAEALDLPVYAHPETWRLWGGSASLGDRARPMVDGDILDLGPERLVAMHTPGHAAGHLAFLEEKRGSLFAGDLVSGLSMILVDSAPGSLDTFLDSLARIRDCGARTLFPAHGPPMISPARDVQRVIDHRFEREGKVLAAMAAGPASLEAIVAHAYEDTPQAPFGLKAAQASAHLDRLVRLGTVRETGSGWERTESD